MACENRFTFESAMAMAERTIKRLWIIILLLIVVCVGTNIAWLIYESQFETVQETSTDTEIKAMQFGSETNIISGGDTIYGTGGAD